MRSLRVFVLLALVAAAAPLMARDLHWQKLDVKAHLDARGRLHVEERQTMVFSGDWNGGERTFNLREGQKLAFERMSRVDPASGGEIAMRRGPLNRVHNWNFSDRNVVRWRARSPGDEVFDNTVLTYLLRYELRNILQREGARFVLDHDFAFSDRVGVIEAFQLELTLDPVWKTDGALPRVWSAENIPIGKSFVVRVPLTWTDPGAGPAKDSLLSDEGRLLLGALGVVPLVLLAWALLRETMLGRFEKVKPEEISRHWIETNVLSERPEVIGAMWDRSVGAPEVAATIARLVSEKKLESSVRGDEMSLTLRSRDGLEGYEKELIDGLFFDGGNHTSTSKIRTHYKAAGFDPAAKIKDGLSARVEAKLARGQASKPWGFHLWLLFLGAIAGLIYTGWQFANLRGPAFFIGLFGTFLCGFVLIAPATWASRKARGLITALLSLIPAAIVGGAVALFLRLSEKDNGPFMPLELKVSLTLFALWIVCAAIHALRSKESRESIALLRRMGAVRDWIRDELRKEKPALHDDWYPWLLAFGLGGDVDDWFRSFPAASRARSSSSSFSPSSSSSSGSSFGSRSSSWSGGGGAFGGAGASGMWAVAASGMAAGVSAPSSSSSGGGSSSSSGGGSSGGGGGGGW